MPDDQPLPPSLLDRLSALLGPRGLLTDPADLEPHLADWRALYRGRTPCVVRPGSVAELAEAVKLCAAAGAPLVPQGGNTSMVGGATPDEGGRQIVVSMARLIPAIVTRSIDVGGTGQMDLDRAAVHGSSADNKWMVDGMDDSSTTANATSANFYPDPYTFEETT